MSKDRLEHVLDIIIDRFDLIGEQDYDNVVTLYNAIHEPIFKLVILDDKLFVMYHLDTTPTDAIIWFSRLRNIEPDIELAENWLEVNGEVITGGEAEYIKSQGNSSSKKPTLTEEELKELDKKPHFSIKSAFDALKVIKSKGRGNGH